MRLFAFERRWFHIAFDTILPSGATENLPIGAKDVPMNAFLDDLLVHSPGRITLGFRLAIWFLIWSPILFLRSFRRFTGLSESARVQWLRRLERSRFYVIRELPVVIKTVACLGYCGLPTVQEQIGIHPVDSRPPTWARERNVGGEE
jgi:hypothetical protein